MEHEEKETRSQEGAQPTQGADEQENAAADTVQEEPQEQLTLYKKKKRNGKYISELDAKTLEALQKRKSIFMYLSTLFFAVSLFLEVEGRAKLADNRSLFALFTLYVLAELALIVLTVYIAVCNRTSQKIGPELKERNVPRDGLDRHTFRSYEWFNVLHILMAAGEIAVSVYGFGVWGALNIAASAASAACSIVSRQILFKANAGRLELIEGSDEEEEKPKKEKKKKKT